MYVGEVGTDDLFQDAIIGKRRGIVSINMSMSKITADSTSFAGDIATFRH